MKLLFVLLAIVPLVYCTHLTEEDQVLVQAMSAEQLELALPWRPIIKAICKILATVVGATCDTACPAAAEVIHFPAVLCPIICGVIHCPLKTA